MENTENIDLNKVPEHNESWLQILRLNRLWEMCNYCSTKGDYIQWRYTLDTIYRELVSDYFKMDNKHDFKSLINHPRTIEYNLLNKAINEAFNSRNTVDIYKSLHDKHIFLKLLQNEVGKGTKYRDDDMGAL